MLLGPRIPHCTPPAPQGRGSPNTGPGDGDVVEGDYGLGAWDELSNFCKLQMLLLTHSCLGTLTWCPGEQSCLHTKSSLEASDAPPASLNPIQEGWVPPPAHWRASFLGVSSRLTRLASHRLMSSHRPPGSIQSNCLNEKTSQDGLGGFNCAGNLSGSSPGPWPLPGA